jgi:hypothetical protein
MRNLITSCEIKLPAWGGVQTYGKFLEKPIAFAEKKKHN